MVCKLYLDKAVKTEEEKNNYRHLQQIQSIPCPNVSGTLTYSVSFFLVPLFLGF